MTGNMIGGIREDTQEISRCNEEVKTFTVLLLEGGYHDRNDAVDCLGITVRKW